MAYCPLSKIMHEWCLTAEFDNYHEASGLRALSRTLSYRFEAEELDGKWNCMVCNNEPSEVSKRIGRHHAFIIYFKIACESRRLSRSFSSRLNCKNLRSNNKKFHRSSCIKKWLRNFGVSATSCRTKNVWMFMEDSRKSREKSGIHFGSLRDRP